MMPRGLWVLGLLVVVVSVLSASAALFMVNGGTLQSFSVPVDVQSAAPQPPSELACTKTGFLERRLEWPAALADGYRVYHDGPFGDHDFRLLGQVSSPATTYEGLVASLLPHRWLVTSTLGSAESRPSDIIEANCRPSWFWFSAPCCLSGVNHQSGRSVELNWGSVTGAVYYAVLRGTQSGGPYEVLTLIDGTAYIDTSAGATTTYFYVVLALDSQGNESDPSAEVAVPDYINDVPSSSEWVPTPDPAATWAPPPMPTPTSTLTPDPTATIALAASPVASMTPKPFHPWAPAQTSTATPTATDTPVPTATSTPTPTPTSTATSTPTVTSTPTPTFAGE